MLFFVFDEAVVPVIGDDGQTVLLSLSGDPHIVLGDRQTALPLLSPQLPVVTSGDRVHIEQLTSGLKAVQHGVVLDRLRPDGEAEAQLTEDDNAEVEVEVLDELDDVRDTAEEGARDVAVEDAPTTHSGRPACSPLESLP